MRPRQHHLWATPKTGDVIGIAPGVRARSDKRCDGTPPAHANKRVEVSWWHGRFATNAGQSSRFEQRGVVLAFPQHDVLGAPSASVYSTRTR